VGGTVVDVGCGTGRTLPALRTAVGPAGTVIGLDVTPQMLAVARTHSAVAAAGLILADARRLPFADASVDAIFAAGLIMHLPGTDSGLRELARVTRPGGRLVLFHPSGRAALAARHGRALRPDESLAEGPLRSSAGRTGWQITSYDDSPDRFLAIAERASPGHHPATHTRAELNQVADHIGADHEYWRARGIRVAGVVVPHDGTTVEILTPHADTARALLLQRYGDTRVTVTLGDIVPL
jgi:SAM-dependent methyltransferase